MAINRTAFPVTVLYMQVNIKKERETLRTLVAANAAGSINQGSRLEPARPE
jgi:hypothetical protein